MIVRAVRTKPVRSRGSALTELIEQSVPALPERSILVVTSKIVALSEGRTFPITPTDQRMLIEQEADYVLPPRNDGRFQLTIKQGILIPNAGIDASNGAGEYVRWPADPQRSANQLRRWLVQHYHRQSVGVLITDSTCRPLRRGTSGIPLAHSGFWALRDYVGQPDVFGRFLEHTKANVADALAAAAVGVMGEGNEQTPLAVIEELPFVTFQHRDPSPGELADLRIDLADDIYAPLLTAVPWQTQPGRPLDAPSQRS